MKFYRLIYLLPLLLTACVGGQDGGLLPENEKVYFDLSGFINRQIELLEAIDLVVEKKAMYEGKQQQQVFDDPGSWENELAMFRDADINKPVLVNSYDSVQRQEDGYQVTSYVAIDESVRIQELSIFYTESQVKKVEILLLEDNFFYITRQHMQLQIANCLISKIGISGFQKLVTRNRKEYAVEVAIRKAQG